MSVLRDGDLLVRLYPTKDSWPNPAVLGKPESRVWRGAGRRVRARTCCVLILRFSRLLEQRDQAGCVRQSFGGLLGEQKTMSSPTS